VKSSLTFVRKTPYARRKMERWFISELPPAPPRHSSQPDQPALDAPSAVTQPAPMKKLLLPVLFTALLLPARAADQAKPAAKAAPVTATFYITDVKCSSCAASIDESLRKLPSVTKIADLSESTGFALITFDPQTVSYHQVAQAVFAAAPVHGDAYVASLKFIIPAYAKGDNAAKVDAVFAQHKSNVRVELKNKARGEFQLFFEALAVGAGKKGPQGFNLDQFVGAIKEPAPKGLGLNFEVKGEN
jgi:copper chaperone CopZ